MNLMPDLMPDLRYYFLTDKPQYGNYMVEVLKGSSCHAQSTYPGTDRGCASFRD